MLFAKREKALLGHLWSHDLLSRNDVLNGSFAVESVTRRNENMIVRSTNGRSLFVKIGASDDKRATIANEARILRTIQTDPALSGIVARALHYDSKSATLSVEHIEDAGSLRQHVYSRRKFPVIAPAILGEVLGRLHRHSLIGDSTDAVLPWMFSIHRLPVEALRELTGPGLSLINMMQSDTVAMAKIDRAATRWTQSSLIHGDVRWENVLLPNATGERKPRVVLVDFEFAGLGEPSWDIGAALSEYLSAWLLSMENANPADAMGNIETAIFSLDSIQSSVRRFWRKYRLITDLDEPGLFLIKAVEFCGIHLLRTSYELAQGSSEISAHSVSHLQLGLNLLKKPDVGLTQMLGILPNQKQQS